MDNIGKVHCDIKKKQFTVLCGLSISSSSIIHQHKLKGTLGLGFTDLHNTGSSAGVVPNTETEFLHYQEKTKLTLHTVRV